MRCSKRTVSAIMAVAILTSAAEAEKGDGAIRIGDPIVYELSSHDSEVVAVAGAGGDSMVFVVSPGSPCDGVGESGRLVTLAYRGAELEELSSVDLGLGEVTSVAAHPRGDFVAVAAKDPRSPNI